MFVQAAMIKIWRLIMKHPWFFIVLGCSITLLLVAQNAFSAEGRKPISECTIIGQSGSYILTNDLAIQSGDCLIIGASHVIINLDGHSIVMTDQNGAPQGIAINASGKTDITIKNGIIVDPAIGIQFINRSPADGGVYRIENVKIYNPGGTGIYVTGQTQTDCETDKKCARAIIRNCIIKTNQANTSAGIALDFSFGSIIENNILYQLGSGISLYGGGSNIVRNNTTQRNGAYGIDVLASQGNLIERNTVVQNGAYGIYLRKDPTLNVGSDHNVVRYNNISKNSTGGINVVGSSYNALDWNLLSNNGSFGIQFDSATTSNVYSYNYALVTGIVDNTCNPACLNVDNGGNVQQ